MARSTNILLQRAPRLWALLEGGRSIRIGQHTCRIADIQSFAVRRSVEPNILGHLLAFGFFTLAGGLFILPVVMAIARPKFLAGGALFIGIGLTAFAEIMRNRVISLHVVDVRLNNGETVTFTAAEESETTALAAVLANGGRR